MARLSRRDAFARDFLLVFAAVKGRVPMREASDARLFALLVEPGLAVTATVAGGVPVLALTARGKAAAAALLPAGQARQRRVA